MRNKSGSGSGSESINDLISINKSLTKQKKLTKNIWKFLKVTQQH